MAEVRTYRSKYYKKWYAQLNDKEKRVVDSRVDVAREFGVLNKYKLIDKSYSLYEFKWDNGLRVYFSLLRDWEGNFMLLLVGGNKNTQSQDITKSRNLVAEAINGIKAKSGDEK